LFVFGLFFNPCLPLSDEPSPAASSFDNKSELFEQQKYQDEEIKCYKKKIKNLCRLLSTEVQAEYFYPALLN